MTSPPSNHPPEAETYAAVDLGSNSFHLLVARREHGQMRVLDRIKEMVQLGAGLDDEGRLDEETRSRAIDCLARFGQRLRGVPVENIRAVGTQTLRRMRHANSFLVVAETALGCPIDIIGGREEARLIYLGVSQGVAETGERRLVIDIGGGSTEVVIGTGVTASELESLQFGCVSVTRRFFGDGRLDPDRWQQAVHAVRAELQELQETYRALGWQRAIGSSGTIRAVAAICEARGWSERIVTGPALARLAGELQQTGSVDAIDLPGLSSRRLSVIAGGVAILQACFEALGIDRMEVSPFALREGLLHDLLGRLEHRDPRDQTVQAFMSRYGVDEGQARRVRNAALSLYDSVVGDLGLREAHRKLLAWAADLHEIGLGISHSHYQRHSGYLVEESDMAGFSRQEQSFLAALVRFHRRSIPAGFSDHLPGRLHRPLCQLLACLRIAWVLCRTRDSAELPPLGLSFDANRLHLKLPPAWAGGRPLTLADLEQESQELRALDLQLEITREQP